MVGVAPGGASSVSALALRSSTPVHPYCCAHPTGRWCGRLPEWLVSVAQTWREAFKTDAVPADRSKADRARAALCRQICDDALEASRLSRPQAPRAWLEGGSRA